MKKILIVLSVFLAVNTMVVGQETTKPTQKEGEKTMYTCPMHPKEMSSKEGECGKCGMKMVKTTEVKYDHAVKGSQASRKVVTKYVCVKDGQTSDKAGKCPKCGTPMKEVEKMTYSCPMHPKEMSDKPGKCPKCGMAMTPKDSVKKEENHKH